MGQAKDLVYLLSVNIGQRNLTLGYFKLWHKPEPIILCIKCPQTGELFSSSPEVELINSKQHDIHTCIYFLYILVMFCCSGEADDRLEVASGMGQDCSCCGCFGQNRKFQSCLQVRRGFCLTFFRPYLTTRSSLKIYRTKSGISCLYRQHRKCL